jgi:hypothetical protein
MGLVEHWRRIRAELPPDWEEARLSVTVPGAAERARAAALLGPASPGRVGDELRFSVHRSGVGVGPERAATLLQKLDEERTRGSLTLLGAAERQPREEAPREALAASWTAELETLPQDWSDLYAEIELTSSDHLDWAALLLAPLNPTRMPDRTAIRFRAARRAGYGASPAMTARCLERLDEAGIPGRLRIIHVLSDTDNVATQGPVWRVSGRAV